MIGRRTLLLGGIAASVRPSGVSNATEQCSANACSAMLDPAHFLQVATPSQQLMSQWCWAACIEMICKFNGVRLSQQSIVNRIYGGIQNLPADDRVLTSALNAQWVSDDGVPFKISAKVFSPALGLADVSNQRVVDDLKAERPLLNGSGSHATIVARVDYIMSSAGQPQIERVHVIDPYPGAAPPPLFARFLTQQEMTPASLGGSLRYLASVTIER